MQSHEKSKLTLRKEGQNKSQQRRLALLVSNMYYKTITIAAVHYRNKQSDQWKS